MMPTLSRAGNDGGGIAKEQLAKALPLLLFLLIVFLSPVLYDLSQHLG